MAAPAKVEKLVSVNPRNGELIKSYTEHSDDELLACLSQLERAFSSWRGAEKGAVDRRLAVIARIGDALRAERQELAKLITAEMGKNVQEAEAEVLKCSTLCDYFVKNGAMFIQPEEMPAIPGTERTYVVYQPLGTILSIMPWNFPFWQAIRCIIPNFVAGNVVALKHAPNVLGCALKLEEVVLRAAREAGLAAEETPICRALLMQASKTEFVLQQPSVQGVSLTGSTGAGRAVAAMAGRYLKKCVVELGGSDGYIVLKDCADIAKCARTIVKGRLVNTGQSCIGPKRIICEGEAVKTELEKELVAELAKKRAGVDFSVVVHKAARDDIERKVKQAVAEGAKVLYGEVDGGRPGDGEIEGYDPLSSSGNAYYNPVVLTDVQPGNIAFDDEIFGPVFSIVAAAGDRRRCVELHNKSDFGLGGAIFSADAAKAAEMAEQELQAGMVFVNDFVRSDPAAPFGGVKSSGFGRECSKAGVLEFVNMKTIGIAAT